MKPFTIRMAAHRFERMPDGAIQTSVTHFSALEKEVDDLRHAQAAVELFGHTRAAMVPEKQCEVWVTVKGRKPRGFDDWQDRRDHFRFEVGAPALVGYDEATEYREPAGVLPVRLAEIDGRHVLLPDGITAGELANDPDPDAPPPPEEHPDEREGDQMNQIGKCTGDRCVCHDDSAWTDPTSWPNGCSQCGCTHENRRAELSELRELTPRAQVAADIREFAERCAEKEYTDPEHAWEHLRAAYRVLAGEELPDLDEREEEELEDDGCPKNDPDCTGRNEDCHDACEWPEPKDWPEREDESMPDAGGR